MFISTQWAKDTLETFQGQHFITMRFVYSFTNNSHAQLTNCVITIKLQKGGVIKSYLNLEEWAVSLCD